MAFHIHREQRPTVPGRDGTVYVLEDGAGTAAEVWAGFGFNCYRWRVALAGRPLELLYADDNFFQGGKPTRSGIPILFPFPNRIRAGRFHWAGKHYNLPLNGPANRNAIHGFAFDRRWRVLDAGADDTAAWLTGEFQAARDAPDTLALWPADYRLRVTYRLTARQLEIRAVVDNPDRVSLPFGLGYHPYFHVFTGEAALVAAPARSYWELDDSIPTGVRLPVQGRLDLNEPRLFTGLQLDDVLTDLPYFDEPGEEHLQVRGLVRQPGVGATVWLLTDAAFRETVVFTPPHRHAVAIEPYTCATDAIHLQQRGIDAGWQVLPPGASRSARVVLEVTEETGTEG